MSALHLRTARPPRRRRPAPPHDRQRLCECGAPATQTVRFRQFSSTGATFTNHLHVCAACAAIMQREDRTVTRSR